MFTTTKVQASSRKNTPSILNRALFTGIVLVVFLILQVPEAVAGTGTFRDGKFNFCVSIRFDATAEEMQRMREVFQLANQVLYDATDGQHRFGTISLINSRGASDQADIWIHHGGGRGDAGQLLGYGLRGRHINLYNASFFVQPDTMRNALLIVHEFAHFTYGVDDEYRAPSTPTNSEPFAACPGDDRNSSTLNYCIMDDISAGARRLTTTYSVNEFCVDSNHDKPLAGASPDQANDTAQSVTNHGDACWETMSKIERKWRLNAPANLPQDAPPATAPPPIVFDTTCVGQSQRVVLLIDRSGSMVDEERLKNVKTGAFHFINLYGEGDSLGVVSFATAASVDFPLAPMNAGSRSSAQTAVNSLIPNGLTNLPDGLTLALSQLNASGCPDCQKTIILLSDGDSNVGPPPESLIGSLQTAEVKVIAITVGDISVAGEASLKTIATQTGGLYFRGKTANEFVNFLVNLAFGTSPYKAVGNAPQQLAPNQVKEIPVLIEPDVTNTSFAISLFDPTDPVTVSLRDPSGDVITESNAPFGQFTSSSGLKVFKIPNPETGTWSVVLSSGTIKSGKVEVLTYSQHDGTDFWASFDDDNVNRTETLSLHATPTHDGKNVTGATVTGEVVHPNGTKTPITLFDDGAAAHGDVHGADGTYSALFNSYSGPGTYTFNLKYENTSGQTYVGEPIPDENGVVPSFSPGPVPAATRITTITAVVSSVTDTIWFDDTLPEGAVTAQVAATTPQGFQELFAWVDSNPAAYSGQQSHQSRDFGRQGDPPNSVHGHSFEGAARRLTLGANDRLFTYVFLDINNMPREIMLEWKDANGWEHRAYWGEDRIQRGVNGTSSRWFMGSLPKPGHWERLEVPASNLGLVGSSVDGMSFVVERGRATWDLAGKSAGPGGDVFPATGIDEIWIDGAVPQGATATHTNDQWLFAACPTAGGSLVNLCHKSVLAPHADAGTGGLVRQHQYTGGPPQYINKGDVLFAYVFLDDVIMPNQLFIRWHDGTNWRGAYWGNNWREEGGLTGRENWRHMGGLPTFDKWVRLEIPANYLGLEGRYVTGMSFGFFKEDDNAQIVWGRAGKTSILSTAPSVLSSLTRVWSYVHPTLGFYYQLKDVKLHADDVQRPQHFFAYPNKAAGTEPMYEFINKTKREFFYTTCKTCPGDAWQFQRVAFYVYLNAAPGTVPLYLYHNNATQYFMTIDPNEAGGRTLDSDHWAWVYPSNLTVPVQPTNLRRSASLPSPCRLSWLDNSNDEDGFRIRRLIGTEWVLVASTLPNVTTFEDCNVVSTAGNYVVHAYNSIGESFPSNTIFKSYKKPCRFCFKINDVDAVSDDLPLSDNPSVRIASPLEGAFVGRDVAIVADAFDEDGNGSIGKVEFYDSAQKIGELNGPAPYNFTWFNAPLGSHTLTAVARDNAGETGTSAPVHITVSDVPLVTVTSPTNGAVVSGPANVTLQATASDPDGSVAKVEFYSDATKIGEDTTAPYSFPWNGVQAGTYNLTARAIDNLGLAVTSEIVTLTINLPPTVSLAAPTDGQVVLAPANVTLSATATDQDGTVSKVDFYAGTTLIGTKTAAPFTYDWTGISAGTYSITAKVTDDRGAVTTSAPVSLIVNSAPSVNITLPTPNAMVNAPATITIGASASDMDGTIANVDFYQGTTLLGTDTTSPYTFTWNNVPAGSYIFTAKATDNRGVTTTSVAVPVTTPTFYDDFNDNSLDLGKWHIGEASSPAVVSEQSQQLRITLPASTATYNGIGSNTLYDMRGGTVQVELVQSVSQAGWVENFLMLELDAQNYLMIQTGAGNLLLRSRVNGSNDQLIIPYDSTAHRFWRIRHNMSVNSVTFETSPDGITWTARKTVTAGFALTSIRFVLIAGAWGTGNAAPGAAIYNDFQYIPDPSLPGTPAPILSDNFNDNSLDTTKWIIDNLFSGFTNLNVPMNETAQRLEIGPLLQNVNGSSYRGVCTVNSYNFTGAYSYVELVQAPSAATSADAMFTVGKDVNYYYRIYVNAGNLIGQRKVDGVKTTLFTIPYDSINHRFLRIRHSATGSVTLDTAPNEGGVPGTWVQRYSEIWNASISLTATTLEVKGGTWQIEANPPGKVIFDNFVLGVQ